MCGEGHIQCGGGAQMKRYMCGGGAQMKRYMCSVGGGAQMKRYMCSVGGGAQMKRYMCSVGGGKGYVYGVVGIYDVKICSGGVGGRGGGK